MLETGNTHIKTSLCPVNYSLWVCLSSQNRNRDYWYLLKSKVNKSSLISIPLLRNTLIFIVYHLMNLYSLSQIYSCLRPFSFVLRRHRECYFLRWFTSPFYNRASGTPLATACLQIMMLSIQWQTTPSKKLSSLLFNAVDWKTVSGKTEAETCVSHFRSKAFFIVQTKIKMHFNISILITAEPNLFFSS